jgi:hypothetical protein
MAWWGWILIGIFIGANFGLLAFAITFQRGGYGRRKEDICGGDSEVSGEIG